MKRKFVLCLICLLLGVAAAQAQQKNTYSGKWTLDKSKTESLPKEMEQVMTVTQDGEQLTMETKILLPDEPAFTMKDSFTVNGQESDYTMPRGNHSGKGKRTAKWLNDGKGIEVSEFGVFETEQGAVTVKIVRKWSLLDDGKTLVIELLQNGPDKDYHTKRTFVKNA
jgi:hypothetical protein